MEDLKEQILEEYKKGNIVIQSFDGLMVTKLSEFINQPVDGMLYDLNRLESVVLTFLPDPKWVNDYAVAQVIRAMQGKIDGLENKPVNYGWTKDEMRAMLEDVVTVLDLDDYMLEKHGPIGTAPAELVRLVLEQKDREIRMLKQGFTKIEPDGQSSIS